MSDLNSICFVCLHYNINLEAVVSNDAQTDNTVIEVRYVLPELASLNPDIPVYICFSCRTTVHSFYTFKKRCLENYNRLIRKSKKIRDASFTQNQKNNEQEVGTDSNITEGNEELSLQDEANVNDNIVVKHEIIESEDSVAIGVEGQCNPQLEFVKCEAVSDNEQDADLSEEENQLKDSTHMDYQDDANSVCNARNTATLNLVPKKSKRQYEKVYNEFLLWCKSKKLNNYSENVLLAYFYQKSTCCNASTLGSYYSMVKATLIIHENVDISKYARLVAFMKRKNSSYKPKKSQKVFTREQIEQFVSQAPDDTYLMMKMALIFGIAGACSREELSKIIIDDIQNTGSALLVTIRESTKTRTFTIVANKEKSLNFLDLYRKYTDLRLPYTSHRRFFVLYKNGKCSTQVVGVHTLGKIPMEIATFLKLPDANLYTGHCFKRSSLSLMADTDFSASYTI